MEKTGLIQLRVTPELKEAIVKRAKELNMTLSAYLVYLAQKDMKKIK